MNNPFDSDADTDTLSYAWDINDLLVCEEPTPEEAYDAYLAGEIDENEFFAIVEKAEQEQAA